MRTREDWKQTDGARALRRYLKLHKTSIQAFCAEHGLDRITVQRAVNGERQRISVDFALAIERATGGHVVMAKWASETGRPSASNAA